MYFFLLPLYFILTTTLLHATEIGCTHPQVCNLANQMLLADHAVLLKKLAGDPHNDKLCASEVKSILKVKILIVSPLFLQPWGEKILKIREKTTIALSLSPALFKSYPHTSSQVLAHFWLLPEQLKFVANSLASQFKKLKIPYKNISHSSINKLTSLQRQLRPCLEKMVVIISHNALRPFFATPQQELISLKSSKHHGHLNSRQIKKLRSKIIETQKRGKKLLWIIEKNIHLPSIIKQWIAPNDITIDFNALGEVGTIVEAPLKTLLNKLQQATCRPHFSK